MRRRNRVYSAHKSTNFHRLGDELRVVVDGSWRLQGFPWRNGSFLAINFCVPSLGAGDSEESVRL